MTLIQSITSSGKSIRDLLYPFNEIFSYDIILEIDGVGNSFWATYEIGHINTFEYEERLLKVLTYSQMDLIITLLRDFKSGKPLNFPYLLKPS